MAEAWSISISNGPPRLPKFMSATAACASSFQSISATSVFTT
jgi:hypothetical protein